MRVALRGQVGGGRGEGQGQAGAQAVLKGISGTAQNKKGVRECRRGSDSKLSNGEGSQGGVTWGTPVRE